MAPSRVVLAVAAALAVSALACDALLGLGSYQEVDPDGGNGGVAQDSGEDVTDTGVDTSMADAFEGGLEPDASDAGDAPDTAPTFDGAIDGPPLTDLWARWRMPNPDASTASTIDGAASLPNPMAYDGGGDAGTAFDLVTGLTWSTASVQKSDFAGANGTCATMGTGWHVPTRIQLVSLIDFTQPLGSPTIDPVTFPGTQPLPYWTSSQVPGDASTLYWTVDFGTGLVQQTVSGNYYVRCVKEGP